MSFARDSQYSYVQFEGMGSCCLGGGFILELSLFPQRFLGDTDRNDAEVSASLLYRKVLGPRHFFEVGVTGTQNFSTDPLMEFDRLVGWLSWALVF